MTSRVFQILLLVAVSFILGLSPSLFVEAAGRYPPTRNRKLSRNTYAKRERRLKTDDKGEKESSSNTFPPTFTPPHDDDDEKDDDDDDDDEEDPPTPSPVPLPTPLPTLLPTGMPSPGPTIQPTLLPTGAPSTVPTGAPTAEPSTSAPTSTMKPTTETPYPTTAPSIAPIGSPTGAPDSLPTTTDESTMTIALRTFELTVSGSSSGIDGDLTVDTLTRNVQQSMTDYFAQTFPSSFIELELTSPEVTNLRRLQNVGGSSSSWTASLKYKGDATFRGAMTEGEVWDAQKLFLEQYALPSSGNARLDRIDMGGDIFGEEVVAVNGQSGSLVDPETEEETVSSSSAPFTAYATVISVLVVGVALTLVGAIYYVRRSRGNGYQTQLNEGFDEIDPEDRTASMLKRDLEVDTNGHVLRSAATFATTPGSEATQDTISPASSGSHNDESSPANQSAHVSGVALTSVLEEQSHEVMTEGEDEYIAEVGDDNFDVSVLDDADEEFAAVSASKESSVPDPPSASDAIVTDPKTYSNWVNPLLRHLSYSARDCCVKGASRNVMNTTLPHDLMMSDIELAQQREMGIDNSASGGTGDYKSSVNARTDAPTIQRNPTDESMEQSFEVYEDGGDDFDDERGRVRIIPENYHSRPPTYSEGETSMNLSHQASFMTDDMSVGADLLEKAVRDVALFDPEDEGEAEYHVAEYMHQVRRKAQESQQTLLHDEAKSLQL